MRFHTAASSTRKADGRLQGIRKPNSDLFRAQDLLAGVDTQMQREIYMYAQHLGSVSSQGPASYEETGRDTDDRA